MLNLPLPKEKKSETIYFYANGSIPQTYKVPDWASRLYIVCIGSGAGGGASTTGSATGGSGGGSSSVSKLLIPSSSVPKVLYVHVPFGGAGGVPPSGNGGAGGISYVTISPSIIPMNTLLRSGNAGASGVTAGTISTIANMPLAGSGQFVLIAGQTGTGGGASSGGTGTAQTIPTTSVVCMGGTGGGGGDSATNNGGGGTITAIANSYLSEIRPIQSPAGGAGAGTGGSNGFLVDDLFFSFPGMGGSAGNPDGGFGGKGGYGSGGGGGGRGQTTAGNGGAGGEGLVIITAY